MRIIITFILTLFYVCGFAQIKISGQILDATTKKEISSANIIVQNAKQTKTYSFTTANNKGEYSIIIEEGVYDTLKLSIMAVNVESQLISIIAKSQQLDIFTKYKVMKIKEVIVKPQIPIIGRIGDTVTYVAAKYIDANDAVIEDIIKKLPGVNVAESGRISYQGKEISRLYIEGLDMLGGRYAIASKNIDAKDVKSINIYENHQHIKALKDTPRPDEAAMNITLKEEAKGTWTGSILAGGGYPLSWRGEVAMMYFGKNMQSINTYKTNNVGDNVAREFGIFESSSIIGVQLPTTPSLDEDLYLDNNIHALSSNFLFKLNEATQFNTNVNYAHDFRESQGVSSTVHNIVGAAPIVVNETTYAALKSDKINLDFKIEKNKEKSYFNNTLYLNGDFNKDFGNVISNGEQVEQVFESPSLSARNNLSLIIPTTKKIRFDLNSDISYNNKPTSLRVSPMLFPEIFGATQTDDAVQTVSSSKFTTSNSLFATYSTGGWDFAVSVGLNAHIEDMTSELYTGSQKAVDSMRNDINWQRYDFTVGPHISYVFNDNFSISTSVYADFMSLQSKDKVRNVTDKVNKIIINPSIKLNGKITNDLKYTASAKYSEYYGGLYDNYGGFIMTDYRNIATKGGELSHTKNQNYSAVLSYGNALNMIFANIEGAYWMADNNLSYAYSYNGALTYIESIYRPNKSNGYVLNNNLSKQVLGISTLFSIGGSWSRSWSEIIRQGDILNSQNDLYNASFGFNTSFAKWLYMDYKAEYTRSQNIVESVNKIAPINYIKQTAELLFDFGKGFTVSVDCEHFYNNALSKEFRNMVFLGAELTYKTKKLTYGIEGRNLLGTESYSSAFTSDITDYRYSYSLRPLTIIATIRYNF